ncbi:MAG TPA: YihY/virulence factor BrkB family protein [Polyangiaceae bacterium]|jgi:membrane protein
MGRRLVRASRRFVEGLKAHSALEAAAAIAFWFFLSLLPLLVLLGFLVGQVARSRGVDALLTPVLDVAPGTTEDILRHELERMAGSTASVAPLGVVGFLWTASSGLHNLMDVFEIAAKVDPRPWWKQRAIAIGWVLLGLVAACLLAWLLVNVDSVIHANDAPAQAPIATSVTPIASSVPTVGLPGPAPSAHPVDHLVSHPAAAVSRARTSIKRRFTKALHTPTEQLIATGLMLAVGMLLLAGFYRFAVEHPKGVRRRVWPGTFTAVASWLVVSWGFGLYAVSMASYALYYGSLAAVAVMMVWLYLTSLSLVVGAEVNAHLERRVPPLPSS